MELAGIEPASKQGTHRVSTCLAGFVFSGSGWQTAADRNLIPCFLAEPAGSSLSQTRIDEHHEPRMEQVITFGVMSRPGSLSQDYA